MIATIPSPPAAEQIPAPLAHVHNSFTFTLPTSMARAAPFFGPEGERSWAGSEWSPQFLYPSIGKDVPGAVFTVEHGGHSSLWVNTVFDLVGGQMQYVAVIPDVVATVVQVHLHARGADRTEVTVTYDRTALQPIANDDVKSMGQKDSEAGPGWQAAIARILLSSQ